MHQQTPFDLLLQLNTRSSGKAYGATKAHGSELSARVMPDATVVHFIELLGILSEEEAAPHLVWGL